jgi:ParB-like chromosome segregation protein Spo0J
VKKELVSDLNVTYQPLSALHPSPRNARTHTKRQIHQISESIKTFGFTNPVLIDRTNTIIAGHGRFAAAKLLGMDRVPTICLEGLTEARVRAYVIADNRLAEKAGWDKSMLAIELQHLMTIENFDVTVTGFDIAEIDLVLSETTNRDISVPPESERTVTKSGDIWLLSGHRIVCGDSLDPKSYLGLDAAIRRWQKHTGERAIHAITGKHFDEVAASSEVSCD